MRKRYDLVIVGGGPAGSAAALEAVRLGASVLLCDRAPSNDPLWGEMLCPGGLTEAEDLGISIQSLDGVRIYSLRVSWDTAEPVHNDFVLHKSGCALSCDRTLLRRRLQALASQAGADFVQGSARIDRQVDGSFEVTLAGVDGIRMVRGGSLVIATGRSGVAARNLSATQWAINSQIAFTRVYDRVAADCVGVAVIEARSDCWWFFVPIPGGCAAATCFLDRETLGRPRSDPVAMFEDRLARSDCGQAMAGRGVGGNISVRAAGVRFRTIEEGGNCLLAGDARAARDPLAGSGIWQALREGRSAARRALGWGSSDENLGLEDARHLNERAHFHALAAARFAGSERARIGGWSA